MTTESAIKSINIVADASLSSDNFWLYDGFTAEQWRQITDPDSELIANALEGLAQPDDLITITQAAAIRRKLGSPLSRNSIYVAIAAGKLKTFTLPVCGETLLVSQAEIEAYQAIGHKHGIYGDGKTLLEIAAEEMRDDPELEVVEIFRRIAERGIAVKRSLLRVVLATDAKRKGGRFKRTKHGSYALVRSDHKPKGYKHKPTIDQARKRYRQLKRDSDQAHYDAGCYRVPMPEIGTNTWRMEHSENCPSVKHEKPLTKEDSQE